MSKKELTVVIKGPLNSCSLNDVEQYLPYANVIISTWENGNGSSYMPYLDDHLYERAQKLSSLEGVKLIVNKYSDLPEYFKSEVRKVKNLNFGNRITMKFLFYSSAPAIFESETPYVVVTRSDSRYPNLKSFLVKLKEDPEKIVTVNINFRPDYTWKFHPADHVFGGKIENMQALMTECLQVCNMNESQFGEYMKSFFIGAPSQGRHGYSTWGGVDHPVNEFYKFVECCDEIGLPISNEQIIGICFTKIKEGIVYFNRSKEYVLKYFDMVNIETMGPEAFSKGFSKGDKPFRNAPYVNSMDEFRKINCEKDFLDIYYDV